MPALGRKYYVGQLLFNSVHPIIQLALDWHAFSDYSGEGELNGLVAPHGHTRRAFLAFCLLGTLWHICKAMHSGLVLHDVHKRGWKEAVQQRDYISRGVNNQSKRMFNLPWRWVLVVCHERTKVHQEHDNCKNCKMVFMKSEYWIDEESIDSLALAVYELPNRILQLGWLCQPRTGKQIATAAFSLVVTCTRIGKLVRERFYFIKSNGGIREGERTWNCGVALGRSMLLIVHIVIAAYVTFEKNEGLPDVYVYATQTATSPNSNGAHLCKKLDGTERTTTPFLLLQVLDTDEAKATCQLWNSPTYVTLQLDRGNHQIYHVQSVLDENSKQCRTDKATYKVVFVEQSKGERAPPNRLSQTDLQKRRFSGEAKEHGKCVLQDPLEGDGLGGRLAVSPSCAADQS